MTYIKLNLFVKKLGSVQHKAGLKITGVLQGTSRDKMS